MGPKQSSQSPSKKQKSQQEMIDLRNLQIPNQPLKKAFIVVGKMGHGKSSFINTLILPKDQQREQITNDVKKTLLETGSCLKSITAECQLVEVHESHHIFDEKLYAIDTPGIDSQDAMCLVAEQIDNIILQKNCEIIGIAFIINLSAGREVTQNETSSMNEFMKLLKIDKKIKNELLFFILSNWDVTLFKWSNQQIQQCLTQFNSLVGKIGVENSSEKIIKWTNPLCVKEKNFEYFLNNLGGKEVMTEQWRKIQKVMKICSKNVVTPTDHEENVNKFWESAINRILSQVNENNVRYKKEPDCLSFTVQRKVKFEKQLEKKDKVKFMKRVIPGVILEVVGLATIQFGFGFALIYAGSFLTSRGVIGLARQVTKNKQKIEEKPKQNQSQQQFERRRIKQRFIFAVKSRLNIQIINKMQSHIQISDNKIVFKQIKDNKKMKSLHVYYLENEEKIPICELNTEQLQKQNKIEIKLLNQHPPKLEIPPQDLRNKQGAKLPIPQKMDIYVNNPQNLLRLGFDLSCFMPQEQNYYKIIERQCAKMLGEYK